MLAQNVIGGLQHGVLVCGMNLAVVNSFSLRYALLQSSTFHTAANVPARDNSKNSIYLWASVPGGSPH